jgi:mono/diheme cytochrome c family protein
MNNKLYILFGSIAASALMSGCVSRGNNPGWEYAPDMYYSKGYEAYNQGDSNLVNPYGMNMREPVAGTVAVGKLDYKYNLENTGDGYEASANLTAPAEATLEDGRGQYMYNIYCTPCHGSTGNNDGEVFKKVTTLKPAWKGYSDEYIKTLPEGKIYHTLTYGKNNMGSHASVLSPKDRWKVIKYVKYLSSQGTSTASATESSDSTMAKTN